MARRLGSRPIGFMIIAGGVIMLVGMAYAHTLIDGINPIYESEFIPIITPLFMIVSIPVIVIGSMLLKIKHQKPKKDLLSD